MRSVRLLLCSVAALALPFELGAQSTSLCWPNDGREEGLVHDLRDLMTTTDSEDAADRDTMYMLPVVNPSQVQLETKASVCRAAAEKYAHAMEWADVKPVVVIRLGNRGYAVKYPTPPRGHVGTVLIFDPKWVEIGGWSGP